MAFYSSVLLTPDGNLSPDGTLACMKREGSMQTYHMFKTCKSSHLAALRKVKL